VHSPLFTSAYIIVRSLAAPGIADRQFLVLPTQLVGTFGAHAIISYLPAGHWAGEFTIPTTNITLYGSSFFQYEQYPYGGEHYNVGNYGVHLVPGGYSAHYTYDGAGSREETSRYLDLWVNWHPGDVKFTISIEAGYGWSNSGTPAGSWYNAYQLEGQVDVDGNGIVTFDLNKIQNMTPTGLYGTEHSYGGDPVAISLTGKLTAQ
jgi:hypothetical protein